MAFQLHLFIQALIFLSTFIKVSVANEFAVNFTTMPKDAEYFIGSEAILQWEYSSRPSDVVRKIKFGIVAVPKDRNSANEDVAIFVKDTLRGAVHTNTKIRTDVIASLNGRVSVLDNKTASFKIASLTLNDSGRYFCRLEPERSLTASAKTDYVDITVVDIMIDHQNSTQVIESWVGHKITLKCAVKKAFHNSTVRFFWKQLNRTSPIPGSQVDWATLSQKTTVMVKDEHFKPVICSAETDATVQRHEIQIKRLYKPSEPVNLTVQELQSNDTECKVYNVITWRPPQDEGETPLTGYLVEFKHPVIRKISSNRTITHSTEYTMCKLQANGHPRELNVDVRGINKVGHGFRSNAVKVSFFSTPSAPVNVTSSLVRKAEPLPFGVQLSWYPPEESGGMPVVQYSLEYKVIGSPWKEAAVEITNNTHMFILKYEDAYIYEVRVNASNVFGFGDSSDVKIVYFAEKPGPPQNLTRGEVFYDNQNTLKLKLFWAPPKSDGGVAVSHYIVEHKTVKTEWSSAETVSVNKTEFALQVAQSETYTVRVRAVSSLGPGDPSDVINVKLTEKDVKSLARSNKSSSLTATGFFEAFLLLLAVFHASA